MTLLLLLAATVASLDVGDAKRKPIKYAPAYCSRLKFNCKAKAGHVCCRFPSPPTSGAVAAAKGGDEVDQLQRQDPLRSGPVKIRPIRLPFRGAASEITDKDAEEKKEVCTANKIITLC